MIVVPGVRPLTTPDAETVATDVFEELQVAPVVAELRAVVLPTHTVSVPVIVEGAALIVTALIERQPLGSI